MNGKSQLVVSALVLLTVLLPAIATAQVCGDPDGSGSVTVTDGVQVLRAGAGLSSGCSSATCDVNADGATTVTDGVVVLRAAAGLPADLNCQSGAPQAIPCDLEPNYNGEVDRIRWDPDDLPLTMAIDVSETPSDAYTSGDQRAFDFATSAWDDATGLDLIRAEPIDGRASRLRLFYTTDLEDDIAGVTFFDVEASIIKDAEIQINTTLAIEEDFDFNLDTVNHEVGHALGIYGHSSRTDVLMTASGGRLGFPTERDANTLLDAYCDLGVLDDGTVVFLEKGANAPRTRQEVQHGRFDETIEVIDLGNGRQRIVITDYVHRAPR